VQKRDLDEETYADSLTQSDERREMNPWQDYICHEIDICNALDVKFNIPNIQLMFHWAEQILRFEVLQQYSEERHEEGHTTNLKEDWNASNHNLNYLPLVITFQCRTLCFQIRELNIQALAQHWENSAAACNVFPSWDERVASLSSQSYAIPKFMGPQNRRNGKHPDPMVIDFRALHDNTQDAMHHMTIFSATHEFVKCKSRNKSYISNEQLHVIELCIYHGIKIHVEGLEGKSISRMCRCTGRLSWR
jgi:hypothetical protein